jgi:hypothetical protein
MKGLAGFVIVIGLASVASAQTVYNPSKAVFIASADQLTIGPDGTTPLLDHYDLLAFVNNGSGTLAFTQGLGKPTPDGTNTITVTLSGTFLGALSPNTSYVAKVDAVSAPAYGSLVSLSGFSNPFAQVAAPKSATNVRVTQ